MTFDPEIHHRRSIRLRGYDYSQPGGYYVTLCAQGKKHLFGRIVEGEMQRNELGDYIARCWQWLARQYPYVELDEWVVMPNHLHGIIVITGTGVSGSALAVPNGRSGGGSPTAPTVQNGKSGGGSRTAPTKCKPLGRLVGAFKTVSAHHFNEVHGTPSSQLWQRDFYEHVIRNEDELNKIREYIRTNPLRWDSDPENV
jgi:putative transposase